MLGGITPMPPTPDPSRDELPPDPSPPGEPDIDDRAPRPRPIPPGSDREPTAGEDIPPDTGERLNEVRDGLITAVARDRNESETPPPMRLGMNPSVMPP